MWIMWKRGATAGLISQPASPRTKMRPSGPSAPMADLMQGVLAGVKLRKNAKATADDEKPAVEEATAADVTWQEEQPAAHESASGGDDADGISPKDDHKEGDLVEGDGDEAKEGDASQAGSEKRTALFNRLRSEEHLDASEVEQCLKELAPLHNVKEYSMAITARGRVGQWKEALDLLDDMKFKGHPPNAIAYNVAITALERAHKPKR